jgi:hypothetical protein
LEDNPRRLGKSEEEPKEDETKEKMRQKRR